MDSFTHRFFSYILYAALLAGLILIAVNTQNRLPLFVLYLIFAALVFYHHNRYYTAETKAPRGKYFLILELLLALAIQYFDQTRFIELYFFIVLGDALLAYGLSFSLPFAALGMAAYTGMLHCKSDAASLIDFWREVDASLFLSLIYIAVIISARYNIAASQSNRQLAKMLKEKTAELESANEQLRLYADDLKENAELRARDKLMAQLHDNLGHLLTTAAISAQAARVLAEKDPQGARTRLDMVTEQLQSAMQSLRNVIQSGKFQPEREGKNLLETIASLLAETEKRTGICIEHNLLAVPGKPLEALSSAKQAFLYDALMEGLTNGIRHGAATRFKFTFELGNTAVRFRLSDNGKGFASLVPGYGLRKMYQEAERFGAGITVESAGGCTLEILLPLNAEPLPPAQERR